MTRDQRRLDEVTFIAFDTETTGLTPIVDRIVEVAALCFRLDGRELAAFQQLIDPRTAIPDEARRVHGITDTMVRGQPPVDVVLPSLLAFLGTDDSILLAHNAPFDLGFLGMALARLGMTAPPHCLFDTLDLTRRLYPTWPSHALERVATSLQLTTGSQHRALADARLVKEVFLKVLCGRPMVRTVADLARLSPPLTFADAPVFPIEPPARFAPLAMALAENCALTIVYASGGRGAWVRKITPRLVLQADGLAYVIAHCHRDGFEKTFRLDRIQRCWLAEE
ncbi:MAG TPA: exonuclease domain-containing protein [Candidatus Tectomicrobia bacterium]|nr:exonuclease domain-containing protein [Candidatus Tectomicrobia bacterium]